MKLFFNIILYELISNKRQIYSWALPISFFILCITLFYWLPNKEIEKISQESKIWITFLFVLILSSKDIFLLKNQKGSLSLQKNLKIPTIFIFWSKWIVFSIFCSIYFIPILVFIKHIEQFNYIDNLNIIIISTITIFTINLINLSHECLLDKRIKNITLLSPIISMPLNIPVIMFAIQYNINPTSKTPIFLLIGLFLFLFPVLSFITSKALDK